MTWAKTGVEFPDQLSDAGLSDAAYRTHHEVISWLYRIDREDVTDLTIPKRQVRRIAGTADYDQAAKELAAAGFWRDCGDHYVLVHHGEIVKQSLMAQRLKRNRDKAAQQASRDRNRATAHSDIGADVSADQSGDVSAYTDRQTNKHRRSAEGEVEGEPAPKDDHGQEWPETVAPGTEVVYPEMCIGPACDRPARRSCHTCWDHRDYEPPGRRS